MSEQFQPEGIKTFRVLDIVPYEDDPTGTETCFTIAPETKGGDVLLTLTYASPDDVSFKRRVSEMIRYGIDKRGLLEDEELIIQGAVSSVSEQMPSENVIKLGNSPTYQELKDALQYVHDEDGAAAYEADLLRQLVDKGGYVHAVVVCTQPNEIASADDDQVADEMDLLTRHYGTDL